MSWCLWHYLIIFFQNKFRNDIEFLFFPLVFVESHMQVPFFGFPCHCWSYYLLKLNKWLAAYVLATLSMSGGRSSIYFFMYSSIDNCPFPFVGSWSSCLNNTVPFLFMYLVDCLVQILSWVALICLTLWLFSNVIFSSHLPARLLYIVFHLWSYSQHTDHDQWL